MVIATGFFDGVHLGHRLVIDTLTDAARKRDTGSVVVTFWPHPRVVLQQGARDLRLLSSLDEKRDMLLGLGVDRVEVINFTKEFSALSAEEYIKDWLIGEYGATSVLLGYDNHLGRDQLSPERAAQVASDAGLEVLTAPGVSARELKISSTRIRHSLALGQIELAREMLGYDYCLHGIVVPGNRMGRALGFPTANMQLVDPLRLVPGRGVYLSAVDVLGRRYMGMTNIGVRPTLTKDTVPVIETHILDFDEDIYGMDIRVSFQRKIRDEVQFSSAGELMEQLGRDKNLCLTLISK